METTRRDGPGAKPLAPRCPATSHKAWFRGIGNPGSVGCYFICRHSNVFMATTCRRSVTLCNPYAPSFVILFTGSHSTCWRRWPWPWVHLNLRKRPRIIGTPQLEIPYHPVQTLIFNPASILHRYHELVTKSRSLCMHAAAHDHRRQHAIMPYHPDVGKGSEPLGYR